MPERWDASWSSEKMDWETPPALFQSLDDEFHFTIDAAANGGNTKCPTYYGPVSDEGEDGLSAAWSGIVWCNPPYGTDISSWIKKGRDSALAGATVVMLVYARTDTRWFHDYVYGQAEIRFLRGRIRFVGAPNSAPAPSMILIYRPPVGRPQE